MKNKTFSKENAAFDRRDFIKTGATAAALGSLSIERGAFAQASDTVKVALIGCGGRGTGAANQALSTNGDVKLVVMMPSRIAWTVAKRICSAPIPQGGCKG